MISHNTLGILCVCGAMACFTTQDAVIKGLSGDYPLHEVVLVRAVTGALAMLVLMRFEGGLVRLRSPRIGLLLTRGVLLVIANSAYFFAIAAMPLAEAMTVFFVAPLLIAGFSSVLLGEQVGPRRWAAIAVGLVGVLVMLRPGPDTFRAVALLPLVAATAYAAMNTVTRRIGMTDPASTMAFYVHASFIVVCVTMALTVGDGRFAPDDNPSLEFLLRAWVWPEREHLDQFAIVGGLSTVGAYLMSQGYRVAKAATVAPFEYVALPISVFWGITLFGEWPDGVAMLGLGLVLGSGLYVIHREVLAARRARAAPG